jgi:hypothetical protein
MSDNIIEIFYYTDEFCKEFEKQFSHKLLSTGKNKRLRAMRMTLSEVMTIAIYFHHSGYKTVKDYYLKGNKELLYYFPNLVSYSRFIELRQQITAPLFIFLQISRLGACTGISYIDSFKLEACHIKRSSSHKTFRGLARKDMTSMGWFYGFKVHCAINHRGEILGVHITPGNVSDANAKAVLTVTKNISGKLFGDKGYLGASLFQKLFLKGITLFTKVRANMKSKLIHITDKILLKKRPVIESVFDILKEHLSMEHTRHRSISAFFSHIASAFIAYSFKPKKPSIRLSKGIIGNIA